MKSDDRVDIEMPVVVRDAHRLKSLARVIGLESGLRHKDCRAPDRLAVVEQHAGYGRNASVLVRVGIAGEQA